MRNSFEASNDHLNSPKRSDIAVKSAESRAANREHDDSARKELCQLQGVIRFSPAAGKDEEKGVPYVLRIKRALKRRLNLRAQKKIKDSLSSVLSFAARNRSGKKNDDAVLDVTPSERLEAGDRVMVRTKEEIDATLDRWGALKGCGFLKEMASYCGTSQRVLKRVERFIDERDFRLKKPSGIVLLEGIMCSGTETTGRCDRSCFFFWREEWLEKFNGQNGPSKQRSGLESNQSGPNTA